MKNSRSLVLSVVTATAIAAIALPMYADSTGPRTEKWPGVDETVIGKFAEEAGATAREPFIEGDMLLFCFLIAGAVGGFVGGYCFRMLFKEGKPAPK